jgi:hypothetical protein
MNKGWEVEIVRFAVPSNSEQHQQSTKGAETVQPRFRAPCQEWTPDTSDSLRPPNLPATDGIKP